MKHRPALLIAAATLGLLAAAPAAQAQEPGPVTPRLECYQPLSDGTSRLVLGYDATKSVDLPEGSSTMKPAPLSGSPLTSFEEGSHPGASVVVVNSFEPFTWTVNGKSVLFDDATPTCGEAAALPGGGNGLAGPLLNIGVGVVSLPLILLGLRRLGRRAAH